MVSLIDFSIARVGVSRGGRAESLCRALQCGASFARAVHASRAPHVSLTGRRAVTSSRDFGRTGERTVAAWHTAQIHCQRDLPWGKISAVQAETGLRKTQGECGEGECHAGASYGARTHFAPLAPDGNATRLGFRPGRSKSWESTRARSRRLNKRRGHSSPPRLIARTAPKRRWRC